MVDKKIKSLRQLWGRRRTQRADVYEYLESARHASRLRVLKQEEKAIREYIAKDNGIALRASDDLLRALIKATATCPPKQMSKLWRYIRVSVHQKEDCRPGRGGINAVLEAGANKHRTASSRRGKHPQAAAKAGSHVARLDAMIEGALGGDARPRGGANDENTPDGDNDHRERRLRSGALPLIGFSDNWDDNLVPVEQLAGDALACGCEALAEAMASKPEERGLDLGKTVSAIYIAIRRAQRRSRRARG